MTVPIQTPYDQHTANGSTATFAYNFLILDEDDIDVYLGEVLQSSGYSVTGVGASSGGTVVFTSNPANNTVVTLVRNASLSRSTDYQTSGDFKATVVNTDFDKTWLAIQQLNNKIERLAPLFSEPQLASIAATRANYLLSFDSNGIPETSLKKSDVQAALNQYVSGVQSTEPWTNFSGTPTQTALDKFTLAGDQTGTFAIGLRLRCADSSTIYAVVTNSSFAASVTTVTCLVTSNFTGSLSSIDIENKNDAGRSSEIFIDARTYSAPLSQTLLAPLKVVSGGKINAASGATLTVNHTPIAGDYEIFDSSAAGLFRGTFGGYFKPQWLGAKGDSDGTNTGGTDDYPVFVKIRDIVQAANVPFILDMANHWYRIEFNPAVGAALADYSGGKGLHVKGDFTIVHTGDYSSYPTTHRVMFRFQSNPDCNITFDNPRFESPVSPERGNWFASGCIPIELRDDNHNINIGNMVANDCAYGISAPGTGLETGQHTGTASATVLTDSGASWTVDEWKGKPILNTTDGSKGICTGNTATTITVLDLTGGATNQWNTNDYYTIAKLVTNLQFKSITTKNTGYPLHVKHIKNFNGVIDCDTPTRSCVINEAQDFDIVIREKVMRGGYAANISAGTSGNIERGKIDYINTESVVDQNDRTCFAHLLGMNAATTSNDVKSGVVDLKVRTYLKTRGIRRGLACKFGIDTVYNDSQVNTNYTMEDVEISCIVDTDQATQPTMLFHTPSTYTTGSNFRNIKFKNINLRGGAEPTDLNVSGVIDRAIFENIESDVPLNVTTTTVGRTFFKEVDAPEITKLNTDAGQKEFIDCECSTTTNLSVRNSRFVRSKFNTSTGEGTFTMDAAASKAVSEVLVSADSGGTGDCQIVLTPTNAAAAALMLGNKSLYISALNPGGSFTVATQDGTNAAGTETFRYFVYHPHH